MKCKIHTNKTINKLKILGLINKEIKKCNFNQYKLQITFIINPMNSVPI